jgi:hypothetical protein
VHPRAIKMNSHLLQSIDTNQTLGLKVADRVYQSRSNRIPSLRSNTRTYPDGKMLEQMIPPPQIQLSEDMNTSRRLGPDPVIHFRFCVEFVGD